MVEPPATSGIEERPMKAICHLLVSRDPAPMAYRLSECEPEPALPARQKRTALRFPARLKLGNPITSQSSGDVDGGRGRPKPRTGPSSRGPRRPFIP